MKVRSHWELSEPEAKGDDDGPLGEDGCHISLPCGNTCMLAQVSLWKQVNLFRSSFADTVLVFYFSSKIENVPSEKFLLCVYAESRICFTLFSSTSDSKAMYPN